MKATPKPSNYIGVRFEDFVLKQEQTLARLEAFLDMPLARIVVRKSSIGRWKADTQQHNFDFFSEAMAANGYQVGC